jgi:hypothetical protein
MAFPILPKPTKVINNCFSCIYLVFMNLILKVFAF